MLKKVCISLGFLFGVLSPSCVFANVCGDGGTFVWDPNGNNSCYGGSQGNRPFGTNRYDGVGAPVDTNTTSTQGGLASAPRVTIVNKYGAVAWNNYGGFDSAFGKSSREEAEQEALSKCGSDCRIKTTYSNQCAAMAGGIDKRDKKTFSAFLAANNLYKVAEHNALAQCASKASSCVILMSECSTMNDSGSKR